MFVPWKWRLTAVFFRDTCLKQAISVRETRPIYFLQLNIRFSTQSYLGRPDHGVTTGTSIIPPDQPVNKQSQLSFVNLELHKINFLFLFSLFLRLFHKTNNQQSKQTSRAEWNNSTNDNDNNNNSNDAPINAITTAQAAASSIQSRNLSLLFGPRKYRGSCSSNQFVCNDIFLPYFFSSPSSSLHSPICDFSTTAGQ